MNCSLNREKVAWAMMQHSAEPGWATVALEQDAPAPSSAIEAKSDLLDRFLETATVGEVVELGRLDRFLAEPSFADAVRAWVGTEFDFTPEGLRERLQQKLGRDIARIDDLLDRQVNAILHAERFQRLEASWRGLRFLVDRLPDTEVEWGVGRQRMVQVRMLNVSFDELRKDAERAIEFDQSQLFRKVYGEEFDMPGGTPYSALVGDYEFTNHPNDLMVLRNMARVSAAAFSPFISAAHPTLLDLRSFSELERPVVLEGVTRTMEQEVTYLKWRELRNHDDSRFVGLTMPRVLMREPYRTDTSRVDGFRFQEKTGKPDGSEYLWGNAAYAYAAVLVRAFHECGWLADIRGMRRGEDGGGLVTGLPRCTFNTDHRGLFPRPATDVIITDAQERLLGELGFLPLSWCQDTSTAAFHGSQSVQKPKAYTKLESTVNARMSSMLQYMLCVSRFAHYVKVIVRDLVGSFLSPEEVQGRLQQWLNKYVSMASGMSLEGRAKYPLQDARVQVHELTGKPGAYGCRILLQPQFQLDNLVGQIKLETR